MLQVAATACFAVCSPYLHLSAEGNEFFFRKRAVTVIMMTYRGQGKSD